MEWQGVMNMLCDGTYNPLAGEAWEVWVGKKWEAKRSIHARASKVAFFEDLGNFMAGTGEPGFR